MRERNFGFISWVAFFICFCVCLSSCEEDGKSRQTYVIRYKDGEQTIPVTVVLDYKKQTEYVINMNPRTPAKSVTLYDFKQRTIAYKDLTNRECFLGRLTHETLSEESNALQDVKNPVEVRPKMRSLDPRKPALTPTEIRNIAGQKTAVFCRKMNTWLLVPEKAHSISKREANEYEERTYQYHGHRSSQYSHYERETRRRLRNRNQPNFRRRSQRKEGEAENKNGRLGIPEPSPFIPHLNIQSSDGIHLNDGHSDYVNGVVVQNRSSSYQVPQNHYSDQTDVYDGKENGRMPSNTSNSNQNYRYPSASSSDEAPLYSRLTLHGFNLNETDGTLISDHEFIPDISKSTSNHFKKSSSLAKLTPDDTHSINERSTTTNAPSVPFGQLGYANVHSSLIHLLPLYKPLSQEFDFDQETKTESNADNHQPSQQRNIESEGHLLPRAFIERDDKFTNFKDAHNVSQDPDVSINVLEIPRITKEFENVKDNESYVSLSQSEKVKQLRSPVESYPSLSRKHSGSSPRFQKNNPERESVDGSENLLLPPNSMSNVAKETYFREDGFRISQLNVFTTTESPLLTTQEYPAVERTTYNSLHIPSVHTAFQNSEDFNTFQVFPNYIENISPPSIERNLNVHSTPDDSTVENTGLPQSSLLTTEYPLTVEKHRAEKNHRSDIPSEESNDKSPSFNNVADIRRSSYVPTPNSTVDVGVPSYKIRYQSVLRNFKPDEIVIDIGNMPTHTPPSVTSRFHQRILTTIQPAVNSLSSNGIKSDTEQRRKQNSGTTWRSLYPTTKYPRRRISDKSRRPVQNSSSFFPQRSSLNHNRYQAPKSPVRINQLVGVNQFSSAHHNNRRQFHYPSQPIPPSRVIMPTETNQLHISHLNNLPPGVSVHPRHPQAPFADMVHSNRPPTIPFVNDNRVFLKPHRQRHHRKKETHLNSCCRLRGQSGAFQSCCRNGGSCCSRSRRRMQPTGALCCSSSNTIRQIIPSKQIQPPVRVTNQTLPPIRTEKTHRSEVDNKDRCQKEKMCRTLYESTQQVMVCRNAHIEGC